MCAKTMPRVEIRKWRLPLKRRALALGSRVSAPRAPQAGVAALQIAARQGHLDVVDLLLAFKADINKRTKDGWTALVRRAGVFPAPRGPARPWFVLMPMGARE